MCLMHEQHIGMTTMHLRQNAPAPQSVRRLRLSDDGASHHLPRPFPSLRAAQQRGKPRATSTFMSAPGSPHCKRLAMTVRLRTGQGEWQLVQLKGAEPGTSPAPRCRAPRPAALFW